MNWLNKLIKAGEKIKTAIHKRATKDDIANSDWTSCCKGPILKKELEQILELFEELNEADISKVEAMSHPLDLSQPTRKDEVTEENEREELLKNAPSVQSGLFLVPKVIEGET